MSENTIISVVLQWLEELFLRLLAPELQKQFGTSGNRRLPRKILELGNILFVMGLICLLLITKVNFRYWYLWGIYIIGGGVLLLVSYFASKIWEPDLYYFVAIPFWKWLSRRSKKHPWKFLYRQLFSKFDTDKAEIIWSSIPKNIRHIAENDEDTIEETKEFLQKYDKKLTPFEKKLPLIIRREDLEWGKLKKAHRAFSITLIPISTGEEIRVGWSQDRDARYWVDINLHDVRLGIYNNIGKAWLSVHLNRAISNNINQLSKLDETIQSFLTNRSSQPPNVKEMVKNLPPNFHLRWASGGAMLITRYNDAKPGDLASYWVALFFRDIFPVGWNVGNGGSESLEELYNVERLCAREFCEEYVITSGEIKQGVPTRWFPYEEVVGMKIVQHLSPELQFRHIKYRDMIDRIKFEPTPNQIKQETPTIRVKLINTNLALKVKNKKSGKGVHLLFSVNPYELGMEAIGLFFAELQPNWHIIDGEFHLERNILIRRPVGLFNMQWLYDVFRKHNDSLGELILSKEQEDRRQGGKILPEVPAEKYIIFADDLSLRQSRLKKLLQYNEKKAHLSPQIMAWLLLCDERLFTHPLTSEDFQMAKAELRDKATELKDYVDDGSGWEDVLEEMELYAEWLYKYGDLFNTLQKRQKPIRDKRLRTLCPVTWKSLEYIFSHQNVMDNILQS